MKYLVIFLLLLIPSVALAKVYDVEATGEFVMGDTDTKVEARRLALEHAKVIAAEQIGSYLESETVVRDNRLEKEEIRSYAAAILKTTVLSESINLLEGKTTVFSIRIKANVDSDILDKKVKEIRADSNRKSQLERLQQENQKLLAELERVSALIKNASPNEYKRLREQRETLLDSLDKNRSSINVTFEKGTLLNLANISINKKYELLKNIKESVQFFSDNIEFSLSDPQIRDKGSNKVDVVFTVEDWKMPKKDEFLTMVSTFYNVPQLPTYMPPRREIAFYRNSFRTANAVELEKAFDQYSVILRVKLGNRAETVTIQPEEHSKTWMFDSHNSYNARTITFKNLDMQELNEITSIDAKIMTEYKR